MHELGIMISIVDKVLDIAKKNELTQIDTLVLQIGEQSPIVPQFVIDCFAPAIDGTILENTKLKIEMVPGKEFNIKEILAC